MEDECLMTLVVCPYQGAGCTYQVGCFKGKQELQQNIEIRMTNAKTTRTGYQL